MADHVPHVLPGDSATFTASAAVTGGQVVEATGNMTCAATAGQSSKVVGVVGRDAAVNATTHVYRVGIHDLTATGAIAAGDQVVSAAGGTVATLAAAAGATAADINNARAVIGIALEAIANGAKGRIALRIT